MNRVAPDYSSIVLEQVKSLLESSLDGAVVLDKERRLLYYNAAYQQMSGAKGRALARAVAEGKRCYDVFPVDICQSACLGCRAQEAARSLRVEEIKARSADGQERTLAMVATPLAGGYIVETYRDVSAEVAMQRKYQALVEQERDAKRTERERTEALENANAEIRRAQAQLIHQDKMSSLGRLVAGVAHELNNPINFVYGNVDFLGRYMEDLLGLVALMDKAVVNADAGLRKAVADMKAAIEFDFLVEDSRKLITSIRAGAERTAAIVRDLKAFSRAGGGELDETDLIAGIETTLNLIAPVLKHRIKVVKNFGKIPKIRCHAGHINQVFMNILTNAAQSTVSDGTIEVTVEHLAREDAVQVTIADDGVGIPAKVREHMFEPFFTTKEVGEGTGLGLAICENIVHSHGGKISCESTVGEGATFVVTLPVNPRNRSTR